MCGMAGLKPAMHIRTLSRQQFVCRQLSIGRPSAGQFSNARRPQQVLPTVGGEHTHKDYVESPTVGGEHTHKDYVEWPTDKVVANISEIEESVCVYGGL